MTATLRYTLTARLLHWIMAVGFVFMWSCGYAMTTLVEEFSPLAEFLFALHISVGVTLLLLLVLRIAMRLIDRPPPLPDSIQGVERKAAHLGHAALYALPALVIAAGWAQTNFAGYTVQWFSVGMPRIFPESGEDMQNLAGGVHMWLAYGMLAVGFGHVAATAKHRWIDGHDVLYRMAIGKRQ